MIWPERSSQLGQELHALKSQMETQEVIRQYLLGLLPQEQAGELEEQLFIDGELYEELLIAEDELVDQFLAGEMSEREREAIERHFLRAPGRQEQFLFAGALKKYISATASQAVKDLGTRQQTINESPSGERREKTSLLSRLFPRNPALAYPLAGALVLIIVGGIWLVSRMVNRSNQPQTVWAIELTPGLQRDDSGIKSFVIPANIDAVRLQLDLAEDQYKSYQAVVQDIDGRSVITGNNLKAQSASGRQIVAVDVEPARLAPGDYRVKLSGLSDSGTLENLESYPFKVLKK
jgi:hypothetical protein